MTGQEQDSQIEKYRVLFSQLHDKLHNKESSREKEEKRRDDQKKKSRSKPSCDEILAMHAAVLCIDPNADKKTIMKAYREQSHKNHPDKVQHLSAAIQAIANEEMKKVMEAYEYFKSMGRT